MDTRSRTVVVLAAAAAAVAVGLVAVLAPGAPAPSPQPTPPRAGGAALPSDWRTEHWHDVAVDVPADWWYGGGPLAQGGETLACAPEPIVSPEGDRREGRGDHAPGWVGRPLYLTDMCRTVEDRPPTRPYLWFDAPVDTGTVELGGGWTQQTVDVNGSRITVATDDDALRQRILGSATGGETCFADLDRLAGPDPRVPSAGGDEPTVCAYRQEGDRVRLTYADTMRAGEAAAFERAFAAAAEAHRPVGRTCDVGADDFEWVVLDIGGTTYLTRFRGLGCPVVTDGTRTAELTPDLVEPWATGGIPAVVVGPTGGKGAMVDAFIGPMG